MYGGLTDRLHDTPGQWDLVACTSGTCGLAWLHPRPDAESLARAYEHYFTHVPRASPSRLRRLYLAARRTYLARRFGYAGQSPVPGTRLLGRVLGLSPQRRAAFDASVMWLGPVSGGRLLEIGCGNGELLAHLVSLGWQGRGLETDPTGAALARDRGLDVAVGELGPETFAPASFDAVVMSHVIEHVGNPRATLAHCLQALDAGGRLVLLTPNTAAYGHRRFGRDWLHLDPPRHLHLFSATSLRRLAESAGFEVDAVFTVLRDAHWTLGASQRLREAGRYTIGRLPLRLRAVGTALLVAEWWRRRTDPLCGEEVVLIARKP